MRKQRNTQTDICATKTFELKIRPTSILKPIPTVVTTAALMVERNIPLKTYVLKDIRTEEKMAEAELEYFGPLPLMERKYLQSRFVDTEVLVSG